VCIPAWRLLYELNVDRFSKDVGARRLADTVQTAGRMLFAMIALMFTNYQIKT
jgi:hypothetical protein